MQQKISIVHLGIIIDKRKFGVYVREVNSKTQARPRIHKMEEQDRKTSLKTDFNQLNSF